MSQSSLWLITISIIMWHSFKQFMTNTVHVKLKSKTTIHSRMPIIVLIIACKIIPRFAHFVLCILLLGNNNKSTVFTLGLFKTSVVWKAVLWSKGNIAGGWTMPGWNCSFIHNDSLICCKSCIFWRNYLNLQYHDFHLICVNYQKE